MIASNQRALCYLPAHTDPRELSLLRKVFARSRLRFREVDVYKRQHFGNERRL